MAKTTITPTPKQVVERNIRLTGELMKQLMARPKVFESLPDNFELVILPDDDPELRQYNLELLDNFGSEGKPVVFARIKASSEFQAGQSQFSIYTPVPA